MTASEALYLRLSHYGESHQKKANKLIHKVCVPLIMMSILGLLESIPGPVNWAWIFIAGSLFYYARFRNLKVYAVALIQVIPMLWLISLMGSAKAEICFVIFVFAWIGQFVGHKIEGKKPSFLEDLQYLWIGPLWILKDWVKY